MSNLEEVSTDELMNKIVDNPPTFTYPSSDTSFKQLNNYQHGGADADNDDDDEEENGNVVDEDEDEDEENEIVDINDNDDAPGSGLTFGVSSPNPLRRVDSALFFPR